MPRLTYDTTAKRGTKRKAVIETIIGEWDEYGQPVPDAQPAQPAEVALVFPSATCADVKEALQVGRITTNTRLLVVEWDKSVIPTIRRKLRRLGFTDFYVHAGGLDSLDLADILDGEFGGAKLDYAFFDVCGMVTKKLLRWFESNLTAETIAPDAHLAFTFDCSGRIKGQFNLVGSDHDDWGKFLSLFKERNLNGRPPSNETNDTIHFQTYAVYTALNNFAVEFGCVTSYNDTGCPMQVFDVKIRQYRQNRNRRDKLNSILR